MSALGGFVAGRTHIVVTDSRVLMSGHAANRAACVALSAAVQTFAYVALNLGLLAARVEIDPQEGRADVQLIEGESSRAALSGLMAAFHGIALQCPDSLMLADQRRESAAPIAERPVSEEAGAGSYVSVSEVPRLAVVSKPIVAG